MRCYLDSCPVHDYGEPCAHPDTDGYECTHCGADVEPVRERVHSDGSRFSASPTVHAAWTVTMTREYGPRPAAEHRPADPPLASDFATACQRLSRAADGRTFACARPMGHDGARSGAGCYGRDSRGLVRLGYGR